MEGPLLQRQLGDAADAIRCAESRLAHQNSATAQIDLQVVSAILNAHLKTLDGRDALDTLQHEIQAAVGTRTDLDTPSGARDFQRFLITKLRDIRTVVADTGLDDTSKSALMAAWTSLYDVSRTPTGEQSDARPAPAPTAGSSPPGGPADLSDDEMDPYLDSLLAEDDPGVIPAEAPPQAAATPMPMPPAMPSAPNLGGGGMPGFGMPGGLPLAGLPQELDRGRATEPTDGVPAEDPLPQEERAPAEGDDNGPGDDPAPSATPETLAPAGPTTVTLPNGETVTAASPQLAAAIKSAAGGTPILDAFRQQGITIPPPGTAVTDPVDPSRLSPGDIGMFANRHALALGNGKALLNGQIQHISTVKGPSFLGWEHPPGAVSVAAATEAPAPTRPAAATPD
jgi:hypothetical protein